jgi:glycosyltransferase involved in cell wall biosynthesis
MQRVLQWMAERREEVWVVDHTARFRSQVPAGFGFSPLLLPRGGVRAQQVLHRAGLGGLAPRVQAARLHGIAAEFRPELVHAHNLTDLGLACADAGLGPLIVSSWGALSQVVAEPGRPVAEAARRQLAVADAVVVDAPSLLEPVRALAKPGARVEHIPMGADTRRFRPGRSAAALEWRAFFGIPQETFVLLSPRSWAEFYGHQAILRAYVEAFPRFDKPTVLAFVGLGDGPQALPQMAQAWEAVGRTEAARTVRWLPKIRYDEMHILFSMGDAVVNYPARDSFPATLVEAAACDLPAITAFLPTYRGTFVETACTLVEPGQPAALAEAIVEVVNQPPADRASRLAEARRVVELEYDDAVVQQRLWALYRDLARRRDLPPQVVG